MWYEAFEDNSGRLSIYGVDEVTIETVWAASYHGREYEAGQDWCALVCQGADPIADGWELDATGDAAEAMHDEHAKGGVAIASTIWTWLPLGVDVSECGVAGVAFAESAGACVVCPECGEVLPATLKHDGYIADVELPCVCECCGETLS